MSNIRDPEFNRNVVQVYTEEPGYTGYKGLDFTKIDQIEDLLKSGINVNVTGATTLSINSASVSVSNEVEVKNTDNSPIPISNSNLDILDRILVTGATIPTGIAVYQTALNKDLDNVSVYVSGSLPAVNIAAGQSVAVTGILPKSQIEFRDVTQSIIQGSDVIRTVSTQYPLPVVLNSEAGNDIYRFSSNIPVASNGTVTISPSNVTNAVRKEFFIQNLSTEKLYIKYGTLASSLDFHMILAANSSQDAGDGGSLNELNYKGVVSVSGVSPRYVVWERFGPN